MLTRPRLLILLAGLTITGLVASGCGASSAAVQVDDEHISQRDFEQQLDEVYDNEALRVATFGPQVTVDQLRGPDDPPGSYRQEFVDSMLGLQVQFALYPTMLEEQGIELSDGDRDQVEAGLVQLLDQQYGIDATGLFDDLPGDMGEQYLDGFTSFQVLRQQLGDTAYQQALFQAMDAADVSVSSRYGSWDRDRLTVTPPPGPQPAPGTDVGSPAVG